MSVRHRQLDVVGLGLRVGYAWDMAAVDLDHPPNGVVPLPESDSSERMLDPQRWVEQVRRPVPRQLRRRVAEHLAEARDFDEV